MKSRALKCYLVEASQIRRAIARVFCSVIVPQVFGVPESPGDALSSWSHADEGWVIPGAPGVVGLPEGRSTVGVLESGNFPRDQVMWTPCVGERGE